MDIKYSDHLLRKAVGEYKPFAIIMMFSGGDDSLATYNILKEIGVKPDFVIHGRTGTGLTETTKFAVSQIEKNKDKLLLADAGNAYENYVLRKGFFGIGGKAHSYAYHILKHGPFRKIISKEIRKGKRGRRAMLINGARRKESERRKKTMKKAIKIDGPNIWVNIINEFSNTDVKEYLSGNNIKRNPVSVALCKSGECMCGTMQSHEMRAEAGSFDPCWKNWINNLEKEVMKKHPWKWGEQINKYHLQEKKGQLNLFQPMCENCITENE